MQIADFGRSDSGIQPRGSVLVFGHEGNSLLDFGRSSLTSQSMILSYNVNAQSAQRVTRPVGLYQAFDRKENAATFGPQDLPLAMRIRSSERWN